MTQVGSLFTDARTRWHVLMGEVYGRVAGKAIARVAAHADAVDDVVTIRRCARILAFAVDQGWRRDPTGGNKIVPGRSR